MGDYNLPWKARYYYWSANLFGWAKHFCPRDESGYGFMALASLVNTVILGSMGGAALFGLWLLAKAL